MNYIYFKRPFDEARKEKGENWGTCNYYFEAEPNGVVIRQLEIYSLGQVLKYDEENCEDQYGFLTDQPLDLMEFEPFKISNDQFKSAWKIK